MHFDYGLFSLNWYGRYALASVQVQDFQQNVGDIHYVSWSWNLWIIQYRDCIELRQMILKIIRNLLYKKNKIEMSGNEIFWSDTTIAYSLYLFKYIIILTFCCDIKDKVYKSWFNVCLKLKKLVQLLLEVGKVEVESWC